MRFAFITKHRHIWPVSWLCEVLEVSRSGFHAWLNRPLSDRAILDAKLVTAIDTSFKASDRTYGARRVWRDVLEEGLACGLHRVERLMRAQFVFAFQPRHAHFKKFVQIGRHDAQETQTFQQRNFRILRLSQYTAVKRQQAEFSAENAVLLGHGLLLKHRSLRLSSITFCRHSVRFQTALTENLIPI